MLIAKSVNRELWTEAINTACYLLNRVILTPGETKTPFEKWFGKKPSISHLKVFGALAYLHIPKERRGNKFDPRSRKVIIAARREKVYQFSIQCYYPKLVPAVGY